MSAVAPAVTSTLAPWPEPLDPGAIDIDPADDIELDPVDTATLPVTPSRASPDVIVTFPEDVEATPLNVSDHDAELTRISPVLAGELLSIEKRFDCDCRAAMTSRINDVLSTW